MNFLDKVLNNYFYMNIGNREIDKRDYLDEINRVLSTNEWKSSQSTIYTHYTYKINPNNLIQGWKIHISSSGTNNKKIAKIVANLAKQYKFEFKIISDLYLYRLTTEKPYNRAQSGKFIVIYPSSKNLFKILIEVLYDKLKEFEGMYILSDKRYKDCKVLYYRYGGFRVVTKPLTDKNKLFIYNNKNSLIEDKRTPYYHLPDHISEIFEDKSIEVNASHNPLEEYNISKAIRITNSGGVYEGIFNSNKVILKEARPYTSLSFGMETDAVKRRKKEMLFLKKFQEILPIPKLIDSFYAWEHYFIVVEKIEGITLKEFIENYNPFIYPNITKEISENYLKRIFNIWKQIIKIIVTSHERNLLLGDLSLDNFIINDIDKVFYIDLESVQYLDELDRYDILATYSDTKNSKSNEIIDIDYYSLGRILSETLIPKSAFSNFSKKQWHMILQNFAERNNIDEKVVEFLLMLIGEESNKLERIKDFYCKTKSFSTKTRKNKNNQFMMNKINLIPSTLKYYQNHYYNNYYPYTPMHQNSINIESGMGSIYFYYIITNQQNEIEDNYQYHLLTEYFRNFHAIKPGLFTGTIGLITSLTLNNQLDISEKILNHGNLKNQLTNYSFYNGTIGYGMLLLLLWKKTNNKIYLNEAEKISDDMLLKANYDDDKIFIKDTQNNVKLGLLEGNGGAALYFLYLYQFTNNKKYLIIGKKILTFILDQRVVIDKKITFPENTIYPHTSNPYIKSGTAGILLVIYRYYLFTKDKKLLTVLKELSSQIIIYDVPLPGINEGLSGLIYALLEVNTVLKSSDLEKSIKKMVSILSEFLIVKNNNVYTPGDKLEKLSIGFGDGLTGVAFILDKIKSNSTLTLFPLDKYVKEEVELNVK